MYLKACYGAVRVAFSGNLFPTQPPTSSHKLPYKEHEHVPEMPPHKEI